MIKKTAIILLLLLAPTILPGLAFADSYTQDGKPCPPECVSDSMEIVTWYPSPYNEYEELRLYPKFSADESSCDSFDKLGLMYYNKDEQALKVCWQDPSDLSYSWEKIPSEQSGLLRLGNYATGYRPNCSNAILGALVYDTTEKRPYVCALNASNSPVWKPLDSDYDRDGVTDAVDFNDNDLNDATAVEANVETGKTFYARGGSRKTGNMTVSDISGLCGCVVQSVPQFVTCYDGSQHNAYSPGMGTVSYLVGNAYSNPDARCYESGQWYYKGCPCACPNNYTLTLTRQDSIGCGGYSTTSYGYYCKKN